MAKSLLIFVVLAGLPCFAQLYSYRSPSGKLVITDQPVKDKRYKLMDRYIPKNVEEERKKFSIHSPYILSHDQIDGFVTPIARAYGVDPELVKAVIQVESSRNYRALSSKGAQGLMQLIPDTADRFGVKNAFDPRQNIRGGVQYLRFLLAYYEGDVELACAAYNAGEGAVDKYGGVPPYKETRRYVKKIRALYDTEFVDYDETVPYRSVVIPDTDKPAVTKYARKKKKNSNS